MKLSIGAVAVVAVLATPLVGAAQDAALSANVGFVSEYLFRGLPQSSGTASGSGGLDFSVSKFYVGTWAADVAEGAEVDLYLGVGDEWGDFSASLGGTAYLYTTDNFDRPYVEGNLNVGYNIISAEFSYGAHDIDPGGNDKYWFFAGQVEKWGLYAKVGVWGDDADGAIFDGEYYEAGYSVSVSDLDLSASWVYGTDNLMETIGGLSPTSDDHADHTLVFGLSYTFDIDLD